MKNKGYHYSLDKKVPDSLLPVSESMSVPAEGRALAGIVLGQVGDQVRAYSMCAVAAAHLFRDLSRVEIAKSHVSCSSPDSELLLSAENDALRAELERKDSVIEGLSRDVRKLRDDYSSVCMAKRGLEDRFSALSDLREKESRRHRKEVLGLEHRLAEMERAVQFRNGD